jgi:hypothetical protein
MDNRNVWTGILILAIVCMAFFLKPAHGANEYMNGMGGHCESATLEPYMEYNKTENDGTGSADYGYNDDRATVGVRLRIPLGSTCTKEYKTLMFKNEQLKQQLEMLKLCARYKDLELGPEFAEVKQMCSQVKKKDKPATN